MLVALKQGVDDYHSYFLSLVHIQNYVWRILFLLQQLFISPGRQVHMGAKAKHGLLCDLWLSRRFCCLRKVISTFLNTDFFIKMQNHSTNKRNF